MNQLSSKKKKWILPAGIATGIIAVFAAVVGLLICAGSLFSKVFADYVDAEVTVGDKIYSSLDSNSGVIPDTAEANLLCRKVVLQIDQAMKSGDFETFHGQVSKVWQKQITPEELGRALQALIDEGADFSGVETVEAEFDGKPKYINRILEISGVFPTQPRTSIFSLSFIREGGKWGLIGFEARTGTNPLPLPEMDELERLTEQSILEFGEAVDAEDFTDFHAGLSIPFQKQISAAQFKEIFQDFIDSPSDISAIKGLKPEFTNEIALDENGMVELIGTYTTESEVIDFELLFTPEPPNWKLISIAVSAESLEVEEVGKVSSPMEDLVEFLEEKAVLAEGVSREAFGQQLSFLLEIEQSLAR